MTNIQIVNDAFPLSIASGNAFCNRVTETARLRSLIENVRPVLLMSPRRYGKTSLALHAIQQSGFPYAQIDLFSAVGEEDIERSILKGVGKLISRMETMPKRALALASDIFAGSHLRVTLSHVEVSVEVNRDTSKPAYRVLDILERLETLAKKTNKKIILFFDEFQCISEITPNHAMESVLRQVAQLTKSISFIFSGSHRHLLHELFDDRNRPFYKLCEKIMLDRISVADYEKYIQSVFSEKYKKPLSERALSGIFYYSACHPYYVNLLCSRLILRDEIPTEQGVDEVWAQYLKEERSSVAAEMDLLSKNQRKLLTVLARVGDVNVLLSQDFIQQANMSKASIDQAFDFLEKRDYLYKDQKGYIRVLDPLIKSTLTGGM